MLTSHYRTTKHYSTHITTETALVCVSVSPSTLPSLVNRSLTYLSRSSSGNSTLFQMRTITSELKVLIVICSSLNLLANCFTSHYFMKAEVYFLKPKKKFYFFLFILWILMKNFYIWDFYKTLYNHRDRWARLTAISWKKSPNHL